MIYPEIISNPISLAVISALIGVAIAELARCLSDLYRNYRKRLSARSILINELKNHKKLLSELEGSLKEDEILSGLDATPIHHFMNSVALVLSKDESLVINLHEHIQNIKILDHAININDMRSAGFTSFQSKNRKGLKENIKKAIPKFIIVIDKCLEYLN